MEENNKKNDRDLEMQYRTGYQHGYVAALNHLKDLLDKGTPETVIYAILMEFGTNDLSRWRHGSNINEKVSPPVPGIFKY